MKEVIEEPAWGRAPLVMAFIRRLVRSADLSTTGQGSPKGVAEALARLAFAHDTCVGVRVHRLPRPEVDRDLTQRPDRPRELVSWKRRE